MLLFMIYAAARFSSNSEANASELLENPEEMFPRYYLHHDIFNFQPQNFAKGF